MATYTVQRLSDIAMDRHLQIAGVVASRIAVVKKLKRVKSGLRKLAETTFKEEESLDDADIFYLPRNDILNGLIAGDLGLEDYDLRSLIDQAKKREDNVHYIDALNHVHIRLLNAFGQAVIMDCINADTDGKGTLKAEQISKIITPHLSTSLDQRELDRFQDVYAEDSMDKRINYEEFISNVVGESIAQLPKVEGRSNRSAYITKALESAVKGSEVIEGNILGQTTKIAQKAGDKVSGALKQTGAFKIGEMLIKEAKYFDEYTEKLLGSSVEERERRLEKKKRLSQEFDRDQYMAEMKAQAEAAKNPLEDEPEEANHEESSTEAKGVDDDTSPQEPKPEEGEAKAPAEVLEGDEKDLSTTAVMTIEEKKTVWEKRLDRWGEKMKSWKAYRELKKAKRKIETSDNKIIKSARDKIQEAKDLAEDASESWENSNHPLVWKARDIADSMFGETEQGYVKGEFLRIDSGFDEEEFLSEMQMYMIPVVVEAFMRGDLEFLRTISTGTAEAALHQAITQRRTLGHVYDSRILRVTHLDVSKFKLEHGTPQITIAFVCQHEHCVRNSAGDVVEGVEGGMQNVQYVWTLQRTFTNPIFDWEISEFAMVFTQLI
uniref:Tim44-like domain-containing protein n=1 Tax=Amorphochlora amoebiformis TaxID=1561963 RepID=A0A7S0H3C7_9EUKA